MDNYLEFHNFIFSLIHLLPIAVTTIFYIFIFFWTLTKMGGVLYDIFFKFIPSFFKITKSGAKTDNVNPQTSNRRKIFTIVFTILFITFLIIFFSLDFLYFISMPPPREPLESFLWTDDYIFST